MPARTQKFFEDILQFSSSVGTPQKYKQSLVKLQQQFMQDLHPSPTKAATDFNSIKQALFAFGLKGERQSWPIENISGTEWHASTECLGRCSYSGPIQVSNGIVDIDILLESYLENFEGESNAVCRTALDFILNDCLTVLVSIIVLSGCFHSPSHLLERQPKQPGYGWPCPLYLYTLEQSQNLWGGIILPQDHPTYRWNICRGFLGYYCKWKG